MARHAIRCILLAMLSAPVLADGPQVHVVGEGKVTATPSMATIQTGVRSEATTAAEALEGNNGAMQQLLVVLDQHGIADRDVKTVQFRVQPVHKRDEQGRRLTEIAAYQVTNQVQVRVRSLDALGEILDALVEAGSNQISGIQFGLGNRRELHDQARQAAVADARRRAEIYAEAAGMRLGQVVSIDEQPGVRPFSRRFSTRAFSAAEAADVPIATGEQEVKASVEVTYRLVESAASQAH